MSISSIEKLSRLARKCVDFRVFYEWAVKNGKSKTKKGARSAISPETETK